MPRWGRVSVMERRMSLIEGQKFADYEILARLGAGGMGEVYLARQMSLKRRVALKILSFHHAGNESFVARFQSEAALAANLNHPNIVPVYTAGQFEGAHYIAMEYVEGQTLHARLDAQGPIDPDTALELIYQVALALDHAWERARLVHRDIKPENIFIAADGAVKLGDFGLSKSLSEWAENLTLPGTPMGSPHYISPEQARGDARVDFRSDIYSLGCTLFHLLTGRRVFEGDTPFAAAVKHINNAPPALAALVPGCTPALAALVSRLLAKDPAGRPQSYEELLFEIAEARRSLYDPPPRTLGAWILNIILALACAGLGALAVYVFAPWQQWQQKWIAATRLTEPAGQSAFRAEIARLKPDEQIDRVMAKLRELNPAFESREKYSVEEDQVVELAFSSLGLTNLWPVSALTHLVTLHCPGDAENGLASPLADLSPLKNLWLEELDCGWTQVRDLRPLREMDLKILSCPATAVKDLSPLKGQALEELDCSTTQVNDLTPLKGMPLRSLRCQETRVKSLEPLRDLPLRRLWCDHRSPRDLALIRALKDLEELDGSRLANTLDPAPPARRK